MDQQDTPTPTQPLSAPATNNPAPAASNNLLIPLAIIVGFGMIAAAIFFSGNGLRSAEQVAVSDTNNENRVQPAESGSPDNVAPVTEEDWVRGDPNAPIVIVEYSDYDCPFCKNFHETMNQVIAEYGTSGEVAWVYRHFPLAQLHPNAPRIALAAECVGHLGGNEAFWQFSDLVFNEREINAATDITKLPTFAIQAGVAEADFNSCMEAETYMADVEADFNNAVAVGARGTPHSIVIVGDQTGVINGAQPYGSVRQIIENLQSQIESGTQ